MRNLRHLSVISVLENLVSNALYFLINKSSTVKWIAMFAVKKSIIHLSSKDIKLRCMVLFLKVCFIAKIVHYFFEVKKIWDIILPTNIKWYIKSLQFIFVKISTLLVKLILYINLSTNIYADCNKYFLIQSNTYTFKLFLSHKS